MFDKSVRSIIRTGKEHRRLKPLTLTALARCGRQAAEKCRPLRHPAARAAALALSVCVIFTSMPTAVLAAEETKTGLCAHHPSHTLTCGYDGAVEGRPCGNVCAECGGPAGDGGVTGTVSGNGLPAPEVPVPEPLHPEGAEKIILTAFDALDEAVRYQAVPAGTRQDGLNLPATLGASGYTAVSFPGTEPVPEPVTVEGVVWEPDSPWDETAEQGGCIFTPVLPEGYALAEGVQLPEICVIVGERPVLFGAPSGGDYHAGDVEVINRIITANGLNADRDAPEEWAASGMVLWSDDSTKRIAGLNVSGESLTETLDVTGLTGLQMLFCDKNQLTGLDVTGLTGLQYLSCDKNQLTGLDVSGLTGLQYLSCENNQLTGLNVTGLTGLQMLLCKKNQLTGLDVSGLTGLEMLSCGNNQLTELNVTGLTGLFWLFCSDNQLTELNMSGVTGLLELYCDNNRLTGLNVTGLTSLKWLSCYNNQLAELNMSGLTNLKILSCYDNQLTGLDVTGLTGLKMLSCDNNQLTELNMSGLTGLQRLTCENNQLTELNMAGLTSLKRLYCENNQLTGLDVSGLTGLLELCCENNRLTGLDVTGLTGLQMLHCNDNRLTGLDVTGLTRLQELTCENNPLASLKLTTGDRLTVNSAEGGTVHVVSYDHDLKTIELEATAATGCTFRNWTATGATLSDNTANPAGLTLNGAVTITPVFETPKETADTGSGRGSSPAAEAVSRPPATGVSTVATEDGGSVTTLTTASADGRGKKTIVTTEVKKDAAGNVTGSMTTVTTENITTRPDQGTACITVSPDPSAVGGAAQAAGASAQNPLHMFVEAPQQAVNGELQKPDVHTVQVDVILPESVMDSPAIRTAGVTVGKETVEALGQSGKRLEITVRDAAGKAEAVWSLDGQAMGKAAGPSTDLMLGVHTAPVRDAGSVAEKVKSQGTAEGHENGLVLFLTAGGTLPSPAKLTVPATDGTGITAGSSVALYRLDKDTGALHAVPGGIYTVDSSGYVTIEIPAGTRTGEEETWALLPASGTAAGPGDGSTHTVKAGDTLYRLSRAYGCKVEDLLALNPGVNIYNLRPGSDLRVR